MITDVSADGKSLLLAEHELSPAGPPDDAINGGIGNDAVYGGAGADYSNGAAGDDRFVYRRGDGADAIDDNTSIVTTASADIIAATAKGVYAGGTVNTWVGGYYWQTSTNQLLKRQEAGTDTLALEGISADNLSFSWTGAGNDNLLINIAGGPAGDSLLLYQQGLAGHVEKLTLDGMGTMNLAVASAAGATVNGSVDADIIFGLSGNEVLNGNAGTDALYGGAGNDTLSGGTGNDSYHSAREVAPTRSSSPAPIATMTSSTSARGLMPTNSGSASRATISSSRSWERPTR